MTPKEIHNQILAKTLIKNLEKRNMQGFYIKNKKEAKEKALDLIKENSLVALGGSQSILEIGLVDALYEKNYKILDRAKAKNQEDVDRIYREAFFSDYYLASTNAITIDGKLVNIDGTGNRVSAMIYGPKNVILIVGLNKLCQDEESALQRIKNYASVLNTIRLDKNTPCKIKGSCCDCLCEETICCTTNIIRYSREKDRIKIILVEESLGY